MRDLLSTLSRREREILTRFYLHEQSKDQICEEMALTDTQFRLAKSRAKQRLSRMGQQLHERAGGCLRTSSRIEPVSGAGVTAAGILKPPGRPGSCIGPEWDGIRRALREAVLLQ